MFFKNDKKTNKNSVNTAFKSTFIFWGVTLFINALFEMVNNRPIISSSFIILSVGLILFYSTEQIANYFNKSKV